MLSNWQVELSRGSPGGSPPSISLVKVVESQILLLSVNAWRLGRYLCRMLTTESLFPVVVIEVLKRHEGSLCTVGPDAVGAGGDGIGFQYAVAVVISDVLDVVLHAFRGSPAEIQKRS